MNLNQRNENYKTLSIVKSKLIPNYNQPKRVKRMPHKKLMIMRTELKEKDKQRQYSNHGAADRMPARKNY